jgi:16S rRNA (cytosine967-C5)-methyltransferase
MLKPGGTLIYCVCTPLSREGVEVVDRVVAGGLLERAPISADEAGDFANGVTGHGDVLTSPNGQYGHDFFFVSRLRRI